MKKKSVNRKNVRPYGSTKVKMLMLFRFFLSIGLLSENKQNKAKQVCGDHGLCMRSVNSKVVQHSCATCCATCCATSVPLVRN